ncbi:MAG: M20/M25/M40 family metallo-hydrolase, partial [Candidatus Thorarchaeota archaeon]
MIKEKYLEYFKTSENYYDDFIKLLGELVKHPSVAFREPKGIIDCANNLNAIFEHYGYQSKIYPTSPDGSPVVFAEKNVGAPKTLMFYHHYDVQPEDPLDLWQSSPWELVERNDRLYARGTTDDKGEIVISLLGMKLLEDEMGKLPINVKFIVEGEEEAGSNHLPLFTQK